MMSKPQISLVVILFLSGLLCANAQVTNQNFNEEDDRKNWSFSITPYALLASQATNVGVRRLTQSFGEPTSLTDAGFRNFRYRRSDGEGDSELETRVNVLGPFLGVSLILN